MKIIQANQLDLNPESINRILVELTYTRATYVLVLDRFRPEDAGITNRHAVLIEGTPHRFENKVFTIGKTQWVATEAVPVNSFNQRFSPERGSEFAEL